MTLLKLQNEIIYGPIHSRRLVESLGINVMPTPYKLCPFSCVYCHYGFTDRLTDEPAEADLPTPEEVEEALVERLRLISAAGGRLEYITFSGNGEPTVHPRFGEILHRVKLIRDRHYPSAGVALLSNSTTLSRREIREAIGNVDLPIMKLDAGDEGLFQAINRPMEGLHLADIVADLSTLAGITTQTVFMRGSVDNATDVAVDAWIERISEIRPQLAQIYTVDRWPADPSLEKVDRRRLEEIAEMAWRKAGVNVSVY